MNTCILKSLSDWPSETQIFACPWHDDDDDETMNLVYIHTYIRRWSEYLLQWMNWIESCTSPWSSTSHHHMTWTNLVVMNMVVVVQVPAQREGSHWRQTSETLMWDSMDMNQHYSCRIIIFYICCQVWYVWRGNILVNSNVLDDIHC